MYLFFANKSSGNSASAKRFYFHDFSLSNITKLLKHTTTLFIFYELERYGTNRAIRRNGRFINCRRRSTRNTTEQLASMNDTEDAGFEQNESMGLLAHTRLLHVYEFACALCCAILLESLRR